MIAVEYGLQRLKEMGLTYWREAVGANEPQSLIGVGEQAHREAFLWNRSLFAQNNTYVEVSSGAWWSQGESIGAMLGMWFFFVLGVAVWYSLSIHELIFAFDSRGNTDLIWFAVAFSLLCIPLLWALWYYVLYAMHRGGGNTWLFSQMRARIRFNRVTRKVYVLRPENCGGNVILDWDRLQVNLRMPNYNFRKKQVYPDQGTLAPMVLYHPPYEDGTGEDAVPFGSEFQPGPGAACYWEYIRRFMQSKPNGNDQALRDLVDMTDVFTFAGKPSRQHYRYESGCGWVISWLQMLSQATCYWPRFPKEWKSDSGMGEPEDDPVRAGALMTFFVYHQEGKLSEAQWEQGKKVGWVKADAKF